MSVGLGSLWLSAVGGTSLALSWIGSGYAVYFSLFLFVGIILGESTQKLSDQLTEIPWPKTWSGYLLLLILTLRLCQSSLLWGSTDPLFYHLLAPRIWLEQGRMSFISNMPMLMQASYWEQLYLVLLQPIFWQQGKGLIEWQILAQWLHCCIGYIGSAYVLKKILKKNIAISETSLNLAVIAALFSADLYWTASVAKNDWGVCFWTLSGISLLPIALRENEWKIQSVWASGLFFGFALGAKYNSALTIAPLLVCSICYTRDWKLTAKYCLLASISALLLGLVLLKNYHLTGDPLFPAFTNQFSAVNISKSSISLFQHGFHEPYQNSYQFFSAYLSNLWEFSYKFIFPLALVPLLFLRKKQPKWLTAISIACIAILFIYTCAKLAVLRYLGPIIPLSAALGVVCCLDYFSSYFTIRYFELFLQVSILAIILIRSDLFYTDHFGIDLTIDHPLSKAISDLWTAPNAAIQIREMHLAGNSKAWIRQNVKSKEGVVLSADNLSYYLPGITTYAAFEDKQLDDATEIAKNLIDLLPTLQSRGVRYILDSYTWPTAPYLKFSQMSAAAAKLFPDIVVYRDRDSNVIDIQKLMSHR